jgi:hypothetical protein
MQGFVAGIIVKVLSDPKVQQFIKDLLSSVITEKVLPLLPIAVGAAAKAIVDKLPGVEMVGDALEVADDVRETLNEILPDYDLGIPAIDNLLDAWRK